LLLPVNDLRFGARGIEMLVGWRVLRAGIQVQ
jgi:hypothetical protein